MSRGVSARAVTWGPKVVWWASQVSVLVPIKPRRGEHAGGCSAGLLGRACKCCPSRPRAFCRHRPR